MPLALSLLLALAATFAPPAAEAARDKTPHIEAVELVAETAWLAPGRSARVALRIAPEAHWHVYWRNPGDSGLAPSLEWRLPDGVHAGEMQWPEPARIPFGHLVNYGYEGETLFPVEVRADADLRPGRPARLKATADWLVCREDCVPGSAELSLKLPVKAGEPPRDARWAPAFDALTTRLPVRLPEWRASAEARGDAVTLVLRADADAKRAVASAVFFPYDRGLIANAAPQPVEAKDGGIAIRLTKAPQRVDPLERLRGVVVSADGWNASGARVLEVDVPVSAPPAALGGVTKTGGVSLGAALLLAFAGGLILNLMPCVFPVLSIKALGFLRRGGEDARAARAHGAAFAAGALASFWALAAALLALRAAGEQIGWGFQLQSPPFVAAMAFVMFGLGLSLAGVFEVGVGLTAAAGRAGGGSGYAGSFLGGVLATALAAPCTAPFMGAALGYALAVPAAEALLVFTALGAGMAAPYVALSASPGLHARLPKPGPWMEGFKQAMAFPMFAAALWLLWVFGRQTGVESLLRLLAGLLALAAAAWVYGRWGSLARAPRARRAAGATAAILAVAGFAYALPASEPSEQARATAADPDGLPWERYSEARLAALRAEGRPAFVDFTAAWCITCQVNERVALRADAVRARFAALGVAALKADWTSRDPEITRALAALGRSGVPVYALYAAGAAEPTLLPSILSPSIVLDALADLEARS